MNNPIRLHFTTCHECVQKYFFRCSMNDFFRNIFSIEFHLSNSIAMNNEIVEKAFEI